MTTRLTHRLIISRRGCLATAWLLAGVLPLLGWILLAPVSANAAVWEDVTCSLNGHAASTEGWTPRFTGTSSGGASETNTCSTPGGALTASDESRGELQIGGSGAEWDWTAPKGEPIDGGSVTFALTGPYGLAWLSMPEAVKGEQATVLAECFYSLSCKQDGEVPITKHGADGLYAGANCVANPEDNECRQTGGLDAEVTVSSAKILLSDNSRPTAAEVTGSLLEKAASGTASLSFVAGDSEGPGVYGVIVKIDGDPVYDSTPDVNAGKCVTVGTAPEGSRQFEATQPCPQSVPVSVQVPTSSFGNGQHTLTIEAEDAAGASALVYSAPITITNAHATLPESTPTAILPAAPPARGPANGSPASEDAAISAHWSGASATNATSPYGHVREITGRLTNPAGTPITGAVVEVSRQPSSVGAVASSMASTHTDADGNFTINVPTDASSRIQLTYRSHIGDAQPAAATAVTLQVPASLHLTVAPHVTSVGQTIVLSGTLAGTIPPTGKKVVFEAREVGAHHWIEFRNATANSHGLFHTSHRFALPGPERYEFRVVCEREADFPFLTGASNIVHVRER